MKAFSVCGKSFLDSYPILAFTRAPASAPYAQWDFTSGQLPSGCTFARASGATNLVGSVMGFVGADIPRLAANGLLIGPQSTNIFLYSTMTGNLGGCPDGWSLGNMSGGGGVPVASIYGNADGAVAWSFTGTNVRAYISRGSFVVSANTTYTYSAFIESNPNGLPNSALLQFINYPSGATWTFEKGNNYVPLAGERVSLTLTVGATAGTVLTRFGLGVDGLRTGTVVLSRPQIEINAAKATSFIPTGASAATRAADQLTFDIPSGIASLLYTFDDDSKQNVAVTAGTYTVPTNLNRSRIKSIVGSAA